MKRLAVVPSDSIKDYENKGTANYLEGYYNPLKFFDEVYLLSPLEKEYSFNYGMHIIPTQFNQFRNKIKKLRIDMVRAYGGYWAGEIACKNRVNGIPVLVSIHDKRPEFLYNWIKKADFILCVSKTVEELICSKGISRKKIIPCPDSVDINLFKPINNKHFSELDIKFPGKYRILHIGRKAKEKNLDTLIKALKLLGQEYVCIFSGQGDCNPYIRQAQEENVLDRCYFIDKIPNEELPKYYSWCNCMCVPSRSEGFGIVFIEALACESIVVTSSIKPMNEYIKDGYNGILVKDFENPKSLAEFVKTACTNEDTRQKIKENARSSIERFSFDKIQKQRVDVYENILELKNKGYFNRFSRYLDISVIEPIKRVKWKIFD